MAKFTGAVQEFHKFLGPRLRNSINIHVRHERNALNGICQHCGQQRELQSAHVHGRERRTIIESVLAGYLRDGKVEGDIREIERAILAAHEPIESTFLFLCQECHTAYDRDQENQPVLQEHLINIPEDQPIGAHVRGTFLQLVDDGRVNEQVRRKLLDAIYSLDTFGLHFPFLRRQETGRMDHNGYARYYKKLIRIEGQDYYLCSQWLERQRNAFDHWAEK